MLQQRVHLKLDTLIIEKECSPLALSVLDNLIMICTTQSARSELHLSKWYILGYQLQMCVGHKCKFAANGSLTQPIGAFECTFMTGALRMVISLPFRNLLLIYVMYCSHLLCRFGITGVWWRRKYYIKLSGIRFTVLLFIHQWRLDNRIGKKCGYF